MTARGGFTLVEVLVALVLLAMGLSGSMATLLLASRIQSRAWQQAAAAERAVEVADSVVAAGGGEGELEGAGLLIRWSVPPVGWGEVEVLRSDVSEPALLVLEVRR